MSIVGLEDVAEDQTSIDIIRKDLLANRYRAVAVYDRGFGRLLLAPDLEQAEQAFSRPTGVGAQSIRAADTFFPREIEKIVMKADPYWATQKLRGSANLDYQDLGEQLFPEIADYAQVRAMIGVSARSGGTIVELGIEKF